MRLIERDAELPDFAVFHFGGHWFARGVEMAEMVGAAAGEQGLPIRRLPWWLVRLASPFVTTFPRNVGDGVSLATAGAAGQPAFVGLPGRRATHPGAGSRAGEPARAWLPRPGRRRTGCKMRRVPMQRVPTQRVPMLGLPTHRRPF